MEIDKVIQNLKREFEGKLLPPDNDEEFKTLCPPLLEENTARWQRWERDTNFTPKFNPKKESLVDLAYCKSFSSGAGCKNLRVCWK